MRLVSYSTAGVSGRRVGVQQGNAVHDVSDLIARAPLERERQQQFDARGIVPAVGGLLRWLQLGPRARSTLATLLQQRVTADGQAGLPLASVTLHAPLARPGKIVGVGRNYADHAKETGVAPFEQPRIIFKVPSSVSDPGVAVRKPPAVLKMDFEAELAVVIGDFAHEVSVDQALACVAGYSALNDLSAREFQFDVSPAQTTFAKSVDGFCPMGPCVVTPDELGDPQAQRVQCWVNDEPMQDATTADMLFPVATLIAYLSTYMTLEPGDVIATGTPAGIGAFRTPPQWLAAGDRVRVSVSGVGVLENSIA